MTVFCLFVLLNIFRNAEIKCKLKSPALIIQQFKRNKKKRKKNMGKE